MADLIITDPTAREELLANRYPYRSVEIFDTDNPAIDGLALLDHEAPFLELPMLMVAQVDEQATHDQPTSSTVIPGATPGMLVRMSQDGWKTERRLDDGPMVGCFKHGQGAHLLYKEANMANVDEKVELEEKPTQANFAEDDKKEKDDDKSENMEEGEGGGLDVDAVCKAIESGEISVAEMDKIIAAIQAQGGEAEEEAPAEEAPAAPAMAPGTQAMKKGTMDVEMAALSGKLEAMEALNRERDAKELREKDVAEALERMAGRALGADPKGEWLAYHEAHGPAAFKAHIEEMAKTFGLAMAESGATFAADNAPEAAMKFQKDGPDAFEKASKLASEHAQLRKMGGTTLTLDRYIDVGMANIGG
jgi:hypothetical protein